MMRYAAGSIPAGSSRWSPSMSKPTGSPADPTWIASAGRSASFGWGASNSSPSFRSIPTKRRISVSAQAAGALDGLEYVSGHAAGAFEIPPFRAGLDDDHRDVVGDDVVQLPCDP